MNRITQLKSAFIVFAGLSILSLSHFSMGFPAAAYAAEKVTIFTGVATHHLAYVPFYVAEGMGFFKEEGIDIELIPGGGSAAAAKNAMAGLGLFAASQADDVISLRAKGIPFVSTFCWAQKSINKIVVLEESGITTAEQFKGKFIGVASAGGGSQDDLLTTIRAAGLKDEDVKMIPVGFGSSAVQALVSKQIDALATSTSPFATYMYKSKSEPWKLREIRNVAENLPSLVLATQEKELSKKRDLIIQTDRALAKGLIFTRENVPAAIDVVAKIHPDLITDKLMAIAVCKEALKTYWSKRGEKQPLGWHDPEAWIEKNEFFVKLGIMEQKIDVRKAYINDHLAAVNDFDVTRIKQLAVNFGR